MDCKSLMIGDWYQWYADGKYYQYQIKPEDFTKDYVANFEPVLLTPEILEKNGFVKVKREWSSYWYLDFDETIHIEITDKKVLNVWMDYDGNDYDQYSDYCMLEPDYVHELQRALRCCGLWSLADNFVV